MVATDKVFSGSIPEIYHRLLVPLIFEPYARDLAGRITKANPRRVLETAVGPDLFGAVVVFGVIAGAAEELFFRGYMQTRLAEAWGPSRAIVVTAAASRSPGSVDGFHRACGG